MRIGNYLCIVACAALLLLSSSFKPAEPSYEVVFFLAPKCPICQDYALQMRTLHNEFSDAGFNFVGVFPNDHTKQEDIAWFKEYYEIPFSLKKGDQSLARKLNASVTPEVFVLDSEGNVLYEGRIDNTYARIGQRRTKTTTSELRDAIEALNENRTIEISKTQSVGCIIEYR
ncbi:redoxin family protein [Sanyastnella coralliicola]|uniref:redoxin family protein n=1 Tax=Sanyastnella coralliicola TaxID=3069118 RepID=UPI0027BA23CD|nr:redoxin family protein [Longitalea sp. SCSIO 12813]